MRYLFTFFLFCQITILSFAQSTQQISIFFENDKAEITPDAAVVLNGITAVITAAPDYEITLNAYADYTGTNAYNQHLAEIRADAVRSFLENKGIITDKIEAKSWGETRQHFSNNAEENRQKNRRVDLVLKIWNINSPDDFQQRIQARPSLSFAINPSIEETISTPRGTTVIIPPGSFVLEDGTEPAEQVNIVLREALTPAEWISNGLSTTSKGAVLQSGGMLFINALSNGRELKMAEGAEITIALPASKNVDPDMQLFYGQHNTGNTVANWQQAPANTRFRRTILNPDPVFTASPELCQQLQQMKVAIPAVPVMPKLPVLVRPEEPATPHKPKLRPAPQWSQVAKMYSADGNPKGKKLKKAKMEFAKKQEYFSADSVKYARKLEKYNQQMENYLSGKIVYQQRLKEWETDVQYRLSVARKYQAAVKVNCHAEALAKTLANAGKKKVFRFHNLNDAVKYRVSNILSYRYYTESYTGNFDPHAPVYMALFGPKAIKEDAILRNHIRSVHQPFSYDNTADSLIKELHISCGLKALSDSLETVRFEKTALTGSGGQQQRAMAAYVTEITQLGWINVDKFSKDPSEKIALSFNAKEAFAMYAYFPQLNSMMILTKEDETGTFTITGIPEGQPFKLIAVKTENGQLWANQQQLIAKKKLQTTFTWTAYSMPAFRKELAGL